MNDFTFVTQRMHKSKTKWDGSYQDQRFILKQIYITATSFFCKDMKIDLSIGLVEDLFWKQNRPKNSESSLLNKCGVFLAKCHL